MEDWGPGLAIQASRGEEMPLSAVSRRAAARLVKCQHFSDHFVDTISGKRVAYPRFSPTSNVQGDGDVPRAILERAIPAQS